MVKLLSMAAAAASLGLPQLAHGQAPIREGNLPDLRVMVDAESNYTVASFPADFPGGDIEGDLFDPTMGSVYVAEGAGCESSKVPAAVRTYEKGVMKFWFQPDLRAQFRLAFEGPGIDGTDSFKLVESFELCTSSAVIFANIQSFDSVEVIDEPITQVTSFALNPAPVDVGKEYKVCYQLNGSGSFEDVGSIRIPNFSVGPTPEIFGDDLPPVFEVQKPGWGTLDTEIAVYGYGLDFDVTSKLVALDATTPDCSPASRTGATEYSSLSAGPGFITYSLSGLPPTPPPQRLCYFDSNSTMWMELGVEEFDPMVSFTIEDVAIGQTGKIIFEGAVTTDSTVKLGAGDCNSTGLITGTAAGNVLMELDEELYLDVSYPAPIPGTDYRVCVSLGPGVPFTDIGLVPFAAPGATNAIPETGDVSEEISLEMPFKIVVEGIGFSGMEEVAIFDSATCAGTLTQSLTVSMETSTRLLAIVSPISGPSQEYFICSRMTNTDPWLEIGSVNLSMPPALPGGVKFEVTTPVVPGTPFTFFVGHSNFDDINNRVKIVHYTGIETCADPGDVLSIATSYGSTVREQVHTVNTRGEHIVCFAESDPGTYVEIDRFDASQFVSKVTTPDMYARTQNTASGASTIFFYGSGMSSNDRFSLQVMGTDCSSPGISGFNDVMVSNVQSAGIAPATLPESIQNLRNSFNEGKTRTEFTITMDTSFAALEGADVKVCYAFGTGPMEDTGLVIPALPEGPLDYSVTASSSFVFPGDTFQFEIRGGALTVDDQVHLTQAHNDCSGYPSDVAASPVSFTGGVASVSVTFTATQVSDSNGVWKVCYLLNGTAAAVEVPTRGFEYFSSAAVFQGMGGILFAERPYSVCAMDDVNPATFISAVEFYSAAGAPSTAGPTNPPSAPSGPPSAVPTASPVSFTNPPSSPPGPPAGAPTTPPTSLTYPPSSGGTNGPSQPQAGPTDIVVHLAPHEHFIDHNIHVPDNFEHEVFSHYPHLGEDIYFVLSSSLQCMPEDRQHVLYTGVLRLGPLEGGVHVELLEDGFFELHIQGYNLTAMDTVKLVGETIPCDAPGSALGSEGVVASHHMPEAGNSMLVESVKTMPISAWGGDGGKYTVCYKPMHDHEFHKIDGIHIPEFGVYKDHPDMVEEGVTVLDFGWESGNLLVQLSGFGFNTQHDYLGLISPAHDCNMVASMGMNPASPMSAQQVMVSVPGIVIPAHYRLCYYMDNLNTTVSPYPYLDLGVAEIDPIVTHVEFHDFEVGQPGRVTVEGAGLGPMAQAKLVSEMDFNTTGGDCSLALDYETNSAAGIYLAATDSADVMTLPSEYRVFEQGDVILCVSLDNGMTFFDAARFYLPGAMVHDATVVPVVELHYDNVPLEGGMLNVTVHGKGLRMGDEARIVPTNLSCLDTFPDSPIVTVNEVDMETHEEAMVHIFDLPMAGEYKFCYRLMGHPDFVELPLNNAYDVAGPPMPHIAIEMSTSSIEAHYVHHNGPALVGQSINITVWSAILNDAGMMPAFFASASACDGMLPANPQHLPLPFMPHTEAPNLYTIEAMPLQWNWETFICFQLYDNTTMEGLTTLWASRHARVSFAEDVLLPNMGAYDFPRGDEIVVTGSGFALGDMLTLVPQGSDCASPGFPHATGLYVDRIEMDEYRNQVAFFKLDFTNATDVDVFTGLKMNDWEACIVYDGEANAQKANDILHLRPSVESVSLEPLVPVEGMPLTVVVDGNGFSSDDLIAVLPFNAACVDPPIYVIDDAHIENGKLVGMVPPVLPLHEKVKFCFVSPEQANGMPQELLQPRDSFTFSDGEILLEPHGLLPEGQYATCALMVHDEHYYSKVGSVIVTPEGSPDGPPPGPDGNSTFHFEDGSHYDGEVLNGQRHGRGKMVYVNGDSFEGDFTYGTKNGPGKRIFAAGPAEFIEGDYVDGVRTGPAVLKYRSGLVFRGEFNADGIQGEGELELPTGDKYQGNYVNNKRVGSGKFIRADGLVQTINWEEDTKEPKPGEGPIPERTQYLGCVVDGPARDLKHHAFSVLRPVNETLDIIAECENECREDGYHFMGIQEGVECFCGNDYGTLQLEDDDELFRPEEECDFLCAGALGDSGLYCGGDWRNSVFVVGHHDYDPTWQPEPETEEPVYDGLDVPGVEPSL